MDVLVPADSVQCRRVDAKDDVAQRYCAKATSDRKGCEKAACQASVELGHATHKADMTAKADNEEPGHAAQ